MNTHQQIINTIKTMNSLTGKLQRATDDCEYATNTGDVLGAVWWEGVILQVEDDLRRLNKNLGEMLEDSYLE